MYRILEYIYILLYYHHLSAASSRRLHELSLNSVLEHFLSNHFKSIRLKLIRSKSWLSSRWNMIMIHSRSQHSTALVICSVVSSVFVYIQSFCFFFVFSKKKTTTQWRQNQWWCMNCEFLAINDRKLRGTCLKNSLFILSLIACLNWMWKTFL